MGSGAAQAGQRQINRAGGRHTWLVSWAPYSRARAASAAAISFAVGSHVSSATFLALCFELSSGPARLLAP